MILMIAISAGALAAAKPAEARGPADRSTPEAASASFYGAYLETTPGAFPGPVARMRLRRLLSPRLNGLLGQADHAEAVHAWRTGGREPPLIAGDVFTSLFEGAGRFQVQGCRSDGQQAVCQVALGNDRMQRPSRWRDRLVLMRAPSGWVVDDVIYGGSRGSGAAARLSQTLRTAIGGG